MFDYRLKVYRIFYSGYFAEYVFSFFQSARFRNYSWSEGWIKLNVVFYWFYSFC